MAEYIDNFSDLKELGIDCDGNDLFNKAANHVQKIASKLDDQVLLSLYGFYKQSIDGPCNSSKPSWFDFKGRSKWEAWKKLNNMPKEEAQYYYIETVKKVDPNFDFNEKNVTKSDSNWIQVSTLPCEIELNEKDKDIIDFIKEHNENKVVKLLEVEEIRSHINDLDQNGMALIHWAADSGSTNMISSLISAGADVNVKDSGGQTPLHYASSCDYLECVQLLLDKGALTNVRDNDNFLPADTTNDNAIKILLSQKH